MNKSVTMKREKRGQNVHKKERGGNWCMNSSIIYMTLPLTSDKKMGNERVKSFSCMGEEKKEKECRGKKEGGIIGFH